jgi:hypothetical protein
MEKAKIKSIADYLKDLEEGLYKQDYRSIFARQKLDELYSVIPKLMDATFKTKDKQLKVLLATLEHKARKYKECIEQRMAVRN